MIHHTKCSYHDAHACGSVYFPFPLSISLCVCVSDCSFIIHFKNVSHTALSLRTPRQFSFQSQNISLLYWCRCDLGSSAHCCHRNHIWYSCLMLSCGCCEPVSLWTDDALRILVWFGFDFIKALCERNLHCTWEFNWFKWTSLSNCGGNGGLLWLLNIKSNMGGERN